MSAKMAEELEEGLTHFGVLGMHWGVRKPETKADLKGEKEKYKKKVEKLESKVPMYEKKLDKYTKLSGRRYDDYADNQAKMQIESVGTGGFLGFGGKPNAKKAQKYAKKLKNANTRYQHDQRMITKYKKKLARNKKLTTKFQTKIKDVDVKIVNYGKATVQAALKK